ncbi:MAG: hypothetical protein GTO18_02950 [Anaerolineales bacterium]|nr:hypothetical protein [Anaerolineales bacterium]
MSQSSQEKPIPIYTTDGEWAALLVSPHIFNTVGEWIGWVTSEHDVYDVDGLYVGWLSTENRILRSRSIKTPARKSPPDPPAPIRAPATIPLPPLMSELPYSVIDVLDEEPERLHTLDTGELKEDMN